MVRLVSRLTLIRVTTLAAKPGRLISTQFTSFLIREEFKDSENGDCHEKEI
jgi:hypothetical protein